MSAETKKMAEKTPPAANYRVYITIAGSTLAGEEIKRKKEEIYVLDPVFISVKADGTGYDTKPVQFVPAGEALRLYAYGLLGDVPMPPGLVPWYRMYREKRKVEKQSTPQQFT